MGNDLSVSCLLLTPTGWLEVDDEAAGYELHEDTKSTFAKSRRTKSAKGDWVAGEFAHSTVPENVTETLAIWVDGDGSQYAFRQRLKRLEECFDQMSWSVKLTIGDLRETWTITMPAEYTVTTQKAFLMATTGYVTAQVPRQPALLIEQVVG